MVVMFAAVGVTNGDLLAATWTRLGALSIAGLAALLACALLAVVARASALAVATPGLSVRRAAVADQTSAGAANGVIVGGGAVGAAAKVAMLRSWGVAPAAIGASLVVTGVVPSLLTWALATTVHLPMVLAGAASVAATAGAMIGLALLALGGGGAALALLHPGPCAVGGRCVAGVLRRVSRRVPARWSRLRSALERFDPFTFTTELRTEVRGLVGRRWPAMVLANLAAVGATFLTLHVALAVIDVQGVGVLETLSVFSLVRVLVAVSPVPGGIGVAELGLVSFLVAAGADRPGAMGAAVLFRAVTWLLPILSGSISWTSWQRSRRHALAPASPVAPTRSMGRRARRTRPATVDVTDPAPARLSGSRPALAGWRRAAT
jgi:putative heme transporter